MRRLPGKPGWAEIQGRLTANLDGLNVPSPVIDEAIASIEAVAGSAGVTANDYSTLSAKEASYRDARSSLRNTTSHFPDAGVYYTQQLRGFFRVAAVQHRRAKSTLESDIRSIEAAAQDTPAETRMVRRDVQLLQQVGATLTSQANEQFGNAFVAAFTQGAPNPQVQANLTTVFPTILGAGATSATLRAAERLIADMGSFSQSVGSSQENVSTITIDVRTFVENGGSASLNPFKVVVNRGPRGLNTPRPLAT